MFTTVNNRPDFPAMERDIGRFWEEREVFARSLAQRVGAKEFVFYDGPPFATGLPHYGHLLAGTIKDIIPRYETMRGRYVERRFGWDCHGLPVEYEMERELEISGKSDIERLGVGVFNEKCRGIVLRYTQEWRDIVTRMGRWVDFDHDYKTMDPQYMESIWWVFKALWEKGLVYEGNKILPYCPRCATPLSNFETNQGYADVQDPAITVRFRLDDEENAYLLAWTTTPWTLPSNVGLAVGPAIAYVRVRDEGVTYYLAQARLDAYYRNQAAVQVEPVSAGELIGRRYQPLFPYFAGLAPQGAFRVVSADFVSTEDGTGIVHMATGFGEDDAEVGRREGLPSVCPIDEEARFTAEVPDYAGREVKSCDRDILRRLKDEGSLVHQSTIVHSYPHCWRCDSPLIYRAVSTWFVRVESLRERLIEANRQVAWMPEHIRDGRFGKWIEGCRDWAISRNRYWGTPLPVWKSADGAETVCVGSIEELERLSGTRVADLHKHFVDGITIPSREGRGPLRRIAEVLDCWFESGAMPYAQAHYPFENKTRFESHFPADFIAEGLDQTRGWFYTLMVLSVALFDRPAFRNVVVNGLVLAEDGRKMSKRLKNYPDPRYMLDTYGADTLRLYMIHSPVVRAEDLRFSEEGAREVMRSLLIPLWNAYSFFVTYANVDHWDPAAMTADDGDVSPNVLDRWIQSALETLVDRVTVAMDSYDLQRAVRPFVEFIEALTNWYIRRSRRRFWKSQDDADKRWAYRTLYQVLLTLSKVAAPFVPFVSESIYRNLRTAALPESVHLCDFPRAERGHEDPELERRMALVLAVVRLGRQLRAEHNLRVKQPLAVLHVVSRDRGVLADVAALKDLIADELNVKQVAFDHNETALVTYNVKANFKALGPRLGARVKAAAGAIAGLSQDAAGVLAGGGTLAIAIEGVSLALEAADVIITHAPREGVVVASDGVLVVALETALTEALVREGVAREFVSRIQAMRKAAGLDVTDRIDVVFAGSGRLHAAVAEHADYVSSETLAASLLPSAPGAVNEGGEACELDGETCRIAIRRTGI